MLCWLQNDSGGGFGRHPQHPSLWFTFTEALVILRVDLRPQSGTPLDHGVRLTASDLLESEEPA